MRVIILCKRITPAENFCGSLMKLSYKLLNYLWKLVELHGEVQHSEMYSCYFSIIFCFYAILDVCHNDISNVELLHVIHQVFTSNSIVYILISLKNHKIYQQECFSNIKWLHSPSLSYILAWSAPIVLENITYSKSYFLIFKWNIIFLTTFNRLSNEWYA